MRGDVVATFQGYSAAEKSSNKARVQIMASRVSTGASPSDTRRFSRPNSASWSTDGAAAESQTGLQARESSESLEKISHDSAVTEAMSTSEQATNETRDTRDSPPNPPARSRRKESLFHRIKKQKLSPKDGQGNVDGSTTAGRRGWRSKWRASNYNSRNEEFHKLFAEYVDPEEILIDDFSCALHKDILQQGRLYVSLNHVCFHANIFGFGTRLVFRWENVKGVTREKTALLFPNALQITILNQDADESETKQYFFSSFVRRDLTHEIMTKLRQNKLMGQPESAVDLRRYVCECYGYEAKFSESEDDVVESDGKATAGNEDMDRDSSSLTSFAQDSSCAASPSLSTASSADGRLSPVQCSCSDHLEQVYIDEEFDTHVDHMFQMLFADNEPSAFLLSWNELSKITDFAQPPWTVGSEGGPQTRSLSYIRPLEVRIGPKTSLTTEYQSIHYAQEGVSYRVEAEVSSAGVPYADTFYTFVEYCLTRTSETSCRLRVGACIRYRKSCFSMVKGMIERSAAEGLKIYHDKLQTHLAQACGAQSEPAALLANGSSEGRLSPTRASSCPPSRSSFVSHASDPSSATTVTNGADVVPADACRPPSPYVRYINYVVIGLLLINLVFCACLYFHPVGPGGGFSNLQHEAQLYGSDLGSLEDWRALLELQHQSHTQETKRIHVTLLTTSQLLANALQALEGHRGPATGRQDESSSSPSSACEKESCPSGNAGLEKLEQMLLALRQKETTTAGND